MNNNSFAPSEKQRIDAVRKKYLDNPPEGYSKKDIMKMSDEDLLDMDYFLNEDVFGDESEDDFDIDILNLFGFFDN